MISLVLNNLQNCLTEDLFVVYESLKKKASENSVFFPPTFSLLRHAAAAESPYYKANYTADTSIHIIGHQYFVGGGRAGNAPSTSCNISPSTHCEGYDHSY